MQGKAKDRFGVDQIIKHVKSNPTLGNINDFVTRFQTYVFIDKFRALPHTNCSVFRRSIAQSAICPGKQERGNKTPVCKIAIRRKIDQNNCINHRTAVYFSHLAVTTAAILSSIECCSQRYSCM